MPNSINQSRFIKALYRQPVDRTPVWIMRQAGRYLPEYRALRAQAGSFLQLCKNPDHACSATLMPLKRYGLDAAIIFSDILLIADAMGLGLHFVEHEGPKFSKPITSPLDLQQLPEVDPVRDLSYVQTAISKVVQELDGKIPLIGFAGSPWTLATYVLEGESSKQFNKTKAWLYSQPDQLHVLLEYLSSQITRALQAQINAGVNAVMVFDSWGGILTDPLYLEFSLHYMQKIVTELKISHPYTPIILFSKNAGRCLSQIAATGCHAVGLDWNANLKVAREQVGNLVALQGNLDPGVLYGTPERIITEVRGVLEQYGAGSGHIFNLGHGITPDVKPENLQILLDAVHTYSPLYHQQTTMV